MNAREKDACRIRRKELLTKLDTVSERETELQIRILTSSYRLIG